jgi:N-hydroxyarylamine O-acetyltransferase
VVKPLVDLDAYCARIGDTGPRTPTLATLQRLHARHVETIPFENLSPFLGEGVSLDLPSLLDKLIRRERGGYCFEHNLLFWQVLNAFGFAVSGLAARVRWNVPDEVVTARSHMLLLVNLHNDCYIADVGFGGLTLTAPLRLEAGVEQATPHEPFRLIQAADAYTLEVKLAGSWKALYTFDLQPQHLADYEVTSWYLANHPQSHFVTDLIAARPAPDRRHALHNNRYSIHYADGGTERLLLTGVDALKSTLVEAFRVRLPAVAGLDQRLHQLLASSGTG